MPRQVRGSDGTRSPALKASRSKRTEMKTFRFGGIHPDDNKFTRDCPVEEMPVPAILAVPLLQHIGKPARAAAGVGDEVKKGQCIGEADGLISARIHAPTSGKVKKIEKHPHPGGQFVQTVFIEPDGRDEWLEGLNAEEADPSGLSAEEKLLRIRNAGVVGMGGAGFPSHVKFSPPKDKEIDTLILNGAECEPYLTADHRLMLENPDEVIKGLAIISSFFKGAEVVIGIEDNKPDAIRVMTEKAAPLGFLVVPLKARYPQGGEKQLINALTGRTVGNRQLPFDVGCMVSNVATAAAVHAAVCRNRPLIDRVLTVSGNAIKNRKNLRARVGTMFSDIARHCGGLSLERTNLLVSGGPMMGKAQYSFEVPVTKITSGILFIKEDRIERTKERPCLRCGRCEEVCAADLKPWLLGNLSQKGDTEQAEAYGLNQCMECGSCSYICPSKRDLVHWIKYAKSVNAVVKKRTGKV